MQHNLLSPDPPYISQPSLDILHRSKSEPSRQPAMAAVLPHAPGEDRQVQHIQLYEQSPHQGPQHDREGSVGANARAPSADNSTPHTPAGSTGKGGRPKSTVWKHFHTEGKRDDKSKREDVRCRSHHCPPAGTIKNSNATLESEPSTELFERGFQHLCVCMQARVCLITVSPWLGQHSLSPGALIPHSWAVGQ